MRAADISAKARPAMTAVPGLGGWSSLSTRAGTA
jgi:hypothetical protein